MLKTAKIYGINGPVIYLKGNTGFRMSEMVYVGEQKLVGEVIALDKDMTTVQVYEETTGLRPGEEVIASGSPVSVTLAPGILNNIFDGIERPLEDIAESSGGAFITRGVSVDSLDRTKKWKTHITVKQGDYLHAGDIIAEVPETHAITHKCMVPPEVEGTVLVTVADGEYSVRNIDPIAGASVTHRYLFLHLPDHVLRDRCIQRRCQSAAQYFTVRCLCDHVPAVDRGTDPKVSSD